MNGSDHYRAAEQLLSKADVTAQSDGSAQYLVQKAQVHATLALAAATSENNSDGPWTVAR